MIQRLNHYGPPLAAAAVFLSLMLFALAGVYTYRQQQHVNQKLCAQTVDNRRAIRSTWLAAERLVLSSTQEEQREQTELFFMAVLRPIPPLRCVDNKPVPKEG